MITINTLSVGDKVKEKVAGEVTVSDINPNNMTITVTDRYGIAYTISNMECISRIPVTAENFHANKLCYSEYDDYVSEWTLSAVLKHQGDVFIPLKKDPSDPLDDSNNEIQ